MAAEYMGHCVDLTHAMHYGTGVSLVCTYIHLSGQSRKTQTILYGRDDGSNPLPRCILKSCASAS